MEIQLRTDIIDLWNCLDKTLWSYFWSHFQCLERPEGKHGEQWLTYKGNFDIIVLHVPKLAWQVDIYYTQGRSDTLTKMHRFTWIALDSKDYLYSFVAFTYDWVCVCPYWTQNRYIDI